MVTRRDEGIGLKEVKNYRLQWMDEKKRRSSRLQRSARRETMGNTEADPPTIPTRLLVKKKAGSIFTVAARKEKGGTGKAKKRGRSGREKEETTGKVGGEYRRSMTYAGAGRLRKTEEGPFYFNENTIREKRGETTSAPGIKLQDEERGGRWGGFFHERKWTRISAEKTRRGSTE